MSTHDIGFYKELKKIIFKLSSNTHLIYFSANITASRQSQVFIQTLYIANYGLQLLVSF